MRIKLEGLDFGFGANDIKVGRRFHKENGGKNQFQNPIETNREAQAALKIGAFEFELDVQEAIEIAKLEGLTLKEVLTLVKDLGSMAIQAKAQKDESLREENRALKEELSRIKEMVKK